MDRTADSTRHGEPDESSFDDRYHRHSASSDASLRPQNSASRLDLHSSSAHVRDSSRSHSPCQAVDDRMSSTKLTNKTALRIDHLTHNVCESHLRHIFGWYGRVQRVHLIPSTAQAKERNGSAYVIMSSVEEAAKAALYMSGGQIDGATLTIKTCQTPTDLAPQPSERRSRESPAYASSSRERYIYDKDRRHGRQHTR